MQKLKRKLIYTPTLFFFEKKVNNDIGPAELVMSGMLAFSDDIIFERVAEEEIVSALLELLSKPQTEVQIKPLPSLAHEILDNH